MQKHSHVCTHSHLQVVALLELHCNRYFFPGRLVGFIFSPSL